MFHSTFGKFESMTVSATGPHAPTRPPVVSRCTAGRWFSSVMEKANAIWKSSSPAGRILEWHRKVLNKHEKLENIWKITVFNSTLSSPPCSVEPLNRLCWFAKTRRTKMCRLRRHGNSMHDTLECCKAWRKRLLWVSDWWFGTFYIFPYIYIYWEWSSQLTNSYFSEGLVNHQPGLYGKEKVNIWRGSYDVMPECVGLDDNRHPVNNPSPGKSGNQGIRDAARDAGRLLQEFDLYYLYGKLMWVWVNIYRYIFRGMNIHLPAILMFTRGTRFWPTAIW